jgi:hypothetical protein
VTGDKVYIVLEGPDMSYYGSAEIRGVYSTQSAADARCRELWPYLPWPIPSWEAKGVEEWEVEDGA